MILAKVIEQAQKFGLEKIFTADYRRNLILENREKQFINKSRQRLKVETRSDISEENFNKITEIFNCAKEQTNPSLELKIIRKLAPGLKLPNFGQIKKVFQEGTSQLSAKQGQVLLVDIWATWCGPCQKPMQDNQQMLERNNWGQKVRIIGVSVDERVEQIKQRVTSKKWQKIQHLTLGSWDKNHDLIKLFGVDGIPFACLVNKNGVIQFTGHPGSVDLEEKINQLLGKEPKKNLPEPKSEVQPQTISQEQYNAIFQTIGNKAFFQQNYMKVFFCSKIISYVDYREGKLRYYVEVQVYLYQQHKQMLDHYQKSIPSKKVNYNHQFVYLQQVPDLSKNCTQCNSELSYPLYWCKWSEKPGDFRCRKCIEKKQVQTEYSYKNNSVLLLAEYGKIPIKSLGSNIQPEKPEEFRPNHFCPCNVCGKTPEKVGEARYICLGCKSYPNYYDFINLCQSCNEENIKKDEKLYQKLYPQGHRQNHPFLRVLYGVRGYAEF